MGSKSDKKRSIYKKRRVTIILTNVPKDLIIDGLEKALDKDKDIRNILNMAKNKMLLKSSHFVFYIFRESKYIVNLIFAHNKDLELKLLAVTEGTIKFANFVDDLKSSPKLVYKDKFPDEFLSEEEKSLEEKFWREHDAKYSRDERKDSN